jgi:hypothetical protein
MNRVWEWCQKCLLTAELPLASGQMIGLTDGVRTLFTKLLNTFKNWHCV